MQASTLDKVDKLDGRDGRDERDGRDGCSSTSLLDKIIQTKQTEVAALKQNRAVDGLALRTVHECGAFRRCFESSLRDAAKVPVIAEIKFKSPSAGQIAPDSLNASLIGCQYQQANVACISVLTDSEYFGGCLGDLKSVRQITTVPILRKDFIIDEVQIIESKESGASAVLLIVAVLGNRTSYFVSLCNLIGIECLVEVHNEQELEIALNSNCSIIGINSRNLQTFVTNLSVAEAIVKKIPKTILKVCESGIKTPEDANRMLAAGFDALLMGECLMKSPSVEKFISLIRRPSNQ